jgi:hypothetical protein
VAEHERRDKTLRRQVSEMTTKQSKPKNEQELAAFYEEARKDPAKWEAMWDWSAGKTPGGLPANRTTYALNIDPRDLETLARYAFEHNVSLDEFIATSALDAAKARTKRPKASSPRKD